MFGKLKSLLLVLSIISGATLAREASALVNDSDTDGLTDQGETTLYFTDPQNPDSDNDTFSDSNEVLAQSNPLDQKSVPGFGITSALSSTLETTGFFPHLLKLLMQPFHLRIR